MPSPACNRISEAGSASASTATTSASAISSWGDSKPTKNGWHDSPPMTCRRRFWPAYRRARDHDLAGERRDGPAPRRGAVRRTRRPRRVGAAHRLGGLQLLVVPTNCTARPIRSTTIAATRSPAPRTSESVPVSTCLPRGAGRQVCRGLRLAAYALRWSLMPAMWISTATGDERVPLRDAMGYPVLAGLRRPRRASTRRGYRTSPASTPASRIVRPWSGERWAFYLDLINLLNAKNRYLKIDLALVFIRRQTALASSSGPRTGGFRSSRHSVFASGSDQTCIL